MMFRCSFLLIVWLSFEVIPANNQWPGEGDLQEVGRRLDLLHFPVPFRPDEPPETGCICRRESPVDITCRCSGFLITEFPQNLTNQVNKISLVSVGIEAMTNQSLQNYADSICDLYMEKMPKLRTIEVGTFHNLPKLRTLYIKQAPKLHHIPDGVFNAILPNFRILRIVQSGLEVIPIMHNFHSQDIIISMVDFDSNRIKNITSGSVRIKAECMNLDYNSIEIIEDWAFHGSHIYELSLKGNRNLQAIGHDAFTGLKNLRRLDLSQTSIRRLPTQGLEGLEVLRLMQTYTLKEFPSVFHFREITEAHLTYSYHCCAFQFPYTHDTGESSRLQSLWTDVRRRYCTHLSSTEAPYGNQQDSTERNYRDDVGIFGEVVFTPPSTDWNSRNQSSEDDGWQQLFESQRVDMQIGFGDIGRPKISPSDHFDTMSNIDGIFHRTTMHPPEMHIRAFCGEFAALHNAYNNVKCAPAPDAFNPCEDVMGSWPLRVCVWIVAIAAMLGNLAVIGVLLASSRMTVSKFLMCHLAFADFCMGLYLLMIASIDVHTIGAYFNYAIYWQHGAGCQVAGFLTVFASELSIFTLTVITLERWYAITYAIHLNRRLQLGTAAKVMTVGWLYALAMASLPLFGISSYMRTSICLPMEHEGLGDLVYLTCLLTLNGFAFMLVCACYLKMYLSIRASRGSSRKPSDTCRNTRAARSDTSVAKRMALLVFTDFACWAPIAFFGLTAVAGYPLIDLTKSKILLVFFYPLNSCANPFLYAILTKQYRRDVCLLVAKFRQKRNTTADQFYPPRRTTMSTNIQPKASLSHERKKSLLLRKQDQRSSTSNSSKTSVKARTNYSFFGSKETSPVVKYIHHIRETPMPLDTRQADFMDYSSEEEKSSPAIRRGSPHPIKNSFTKLSSPNLQQEVILYRVLRDPSAMDSSNNKVPVWCTQSKPFVVSSDQPSSEQRAMNDTCV